MRSLFLKVLLAVGVMSTACGAWLLVCSVALWTFGHLADAQWAAVLGGSLVGVGLCAGRLYYLLV